MTEKRFITDEGLEDVLCWEITDKENENMTCGECVKLLNELHEENQAIQNKVFKLLDWLETEKGINRNEIKEWWNE